MIRLHIPKEPYWIDLPHGVRVKVRPISTAIYEAARLTCVRHSKQILEESMEILAAGGSVSGLPNLNDAEAVSGLSQLIFIQSLAKQAILEWEGVLNPNGNSPAPVNDQTVNDLMQIHSMAESFIVQYTKTHDQLLIEGESCGAGANGTSAAALDIARGAGNSDANAPKGNGTNMENCAPTTNTN